MVSAAALDLHVIANTALGPGLSGGDRIFIELARRWARRLRTLTLYVWEEGYEMCRRNGLAGVRYQLWPAAPYRCLGFAGLYLARTIKGCVAACRLRLSEPERAIIYAASDYWPDALPALLLKHRYPKACLIAAYYMAAPHPLKGFRGHHQLGYRLPRLKELLYYLTQLPIYRLIKRYADFVFVTNELDRRYFLSPRLGQERVITVRGGVDIRLPDQVPDQPQRYDAVFIGRLHPQKGVLELIDIWRLVCARRPGARLAIIGDGPLEGAVKSRVRASGLEASIDMLGFLDGPEKVRVFKASKLVVHPAVYDSGGMAACEAMACGLPGVSFDLPELRTYYPRGMLKVPIGDLDAFAKQILQLLEDRGLYERTSRAARDLALQEWSWDTRASEILDVLLQVLPVT
ncbi:MAG: glycosyltransferase family 4 protein [Deinococcus sp.]|nr:glycosyltransferase family 4 protein [Deinococcus sp.]